MECGTYSSAHLVASVEVSIFRQKTESGFEWSLIGIEVNDSLRERWR